MKSSIEDAIDKSRKVVAQFTLEGQGISPTVRILENQIVIMAWLEGVHKKIKAIEKAVSISPSTDNSANGKG